MASKKLAKAIRAIVGLSGISQGGKLASQAGRDPILGKRGIGYMLPNNSTAQGTTGRAGVTTLGSTIPQDGKARSAGGSLAGAAASNLGQAGAGGNTVDARNPSGSIRVAGEGEYPIKDVFDDTENSPKPTFNWPPMGTGDSRETSNSGSTVNQLDGMFSCDDPGIEIVVRIDGMPKPPDDWEGENQPPNPNEEGTSTVFEAGIRYRVDGTPIGTIFSETEVGAVEGTFGASGEDKSSWTFDSRVPLTSPERYTYLYSRDITGLETFGFTVFREACDVGEDMACPLEAPIVPWPEDGKMQLTLVDGKFIIAPNEPSADRITEFTDDQHSQIDFCFEDGEETRHGTLEQTSDGGFMVYETNAEGVPIGTIKLMNSMGKMVGAVQASDMDFYRPFPNVPPGAVNP